jgi:hypothetical protein
VKDQATSTPAPGPDSSTVAPNGAAPPPAQTELDTGENQAADVAADAAGCGDVAQLDAFELMRTRRERADKIRKDKRYSGRLTMKLLAALEGMLDEPTPERFIVDRGEDRNNTVPVHYQLRFMDDVLLKGHWTFLVYYQDGGTTARVILLIGNRIHPANVHVDERTGTVVSSGDAEILVSRESSGGIDAANSKGVLLMGTETSVLRRVLGQFGPGRDVIGGLTPRVGGADDADAQAENVVALRTYRPDLTAVAGAGDRKAEELQVKLLNGIIRGRGLPASQVANLIRRAVGEPPVAHRSEAAAKRFVDERLSDTKIVLPFEAVAPLKRLLEQATAQQPIEPKAADGSREQDGERGTVPFEPGSEAAA